MALLFFILILIVCVALAFIVLIQNPEGGGLSSSIGGFSNQIMGVKKTTNVLERGTWVIVSVLALFCIVSIVVFSSNSASTENNALKQLNSNVPAAQAPAQQSAPQPAQPVQ